MAELVKHAKACLDTNTLKKDGKSFMKIMGRKITSLAISVTVTTLLIPIIVTLIFPFYVQGDDEQPGSKLFRDKGCIGCHSIGGQGGHVGPALDTVGDRYTAEWIYEWLRNPAAVKPGTAMPNLNLTDDERALLVFYLLRQNATGQTPTVVSHPKGGVITNPPEINPESPENEYLKLGVDDSYVKEQRHSLQEQIQTFIPPLFEPAFTESAFVLPPGTVRIASSFRDVGKISANDVTGQRTIGARFANFKLDRNILDFDAFLGLDHNFTLRVNVPFFNSSMDAALNPGFLENVTAFPTGSSTEIGDISVFLKKKFFDQGNYFISLAGVAGISIPTGSNDQRFNPRTTVRIGDETMLLPLPAVDDMGMVIPGSANGTFRRFSNDGRLPAPLQPGLGTFGYSFGLFATRIFEGNTFLGRGALHSGGLYNIRPENDGIDPGNLLTVFATAVKPVYQDNVSFDLTYLLQNQQEDSYAGKIAVPTGDGEIAIVSRPPFSGGTTQFVATSLILIPNPLFRLTLTGLWRVSEPRLGPSPSYVLRLGLQYTFASGL